MVRRSLLLLCSSGHGRALLWAWLLEDTPSSRSPALTALSSHCGLSTAFRPWGGNGFLLLLVLGYSTPLLGSLSPTCTSAYSSSTLYREILLRALCCSCLDPEGHIPRRTEPMWALVCLLTLTSLCSPPVMLKQRPQVIPRSFAETNEKEKKKYIYIFFLLGPEMFLLLEEREEGIILATCLFCIVQMK